MTLWDSSERVDSFQFLIKGYNAVMGTTQQFNNFFFQFLIKGYEEFSTWSKSSLDCQLSIPH